MKKNRLFIITSVIYSTTNKLCYTPIRSVFSAEERARHTIMTIESIKRAVPDSKILLIELGLQRGLPYNIEGMVDKYLYLGDREDIREAVDSPYKGLGEAIGLLEANEWIKSFDADYYFKISGRYYLNENFDLNHWNSDGYSGKDYYGGIFTVLYGFPKRLYENWRFSLKESIPILLQAESLELIQAVYLEKPLYYSKIIGISGWESHSGDLIRL
ncbi:hypothetical protein [Pseudoneobacillus sp. C159]